MFRAIILFVGLSTASALSAESSGMPQLDPGVWVPQILWLIITFSFLYVVISKVVFPRLSESIEQRNDYISDLLDEAKKLSEQTEKLNKEYSEFIANSKKEAQEIIATDRKKLNSEFNTKRDELDTKIKKMTDEAEKEINNFKNNSINQIKDIANQVASEILNELSIKNHVDEKIISSKIDEISKKRIGDLN